MDQPETDAGPAGPTDSVQPVSRSESGGWYDGPKASDATSANPGQDDSAPAPDHAEPDGDEGGNEPAEGADKGKEGEQGNKLLLDDVANVKKDFSKLYGDYSAEGVTFDSSAKKKFDEATRLFDEALDASGRGGEFDRKAARNKLFDMHVEGLKAGQSAEQKNARDTWSKLNDTWKDQTRKEFGHKLEQSLRMAKSVVEEYGGSSEQQKNLMTWLNHSGLGNHPDFIRMLARIGEQTHQYEDKMVPAGPAGPGKASRGTPGSGRTGWYRGSGDSA